MLAPSPARCGAGGSRPLPIPSPLPPAPQPQGKEKAFRRARGQRGEDLSVQISQLLCFIGANKPTSEVHWRPHRMHLPRLTGGSQQLHPQKAVTHPSTCAGLFTSVVSPAPSASHQAVTFLQFPMPRQAPKCVQVSGFPASWTGIRECAQLWLEGHQQGALPYGFHGCCFP